MEITTKLTRNDLSLIKLAIHHRIADIKETIKLGADSENVEIQEILKKYQRELSIYIDLNNKLRDID